VKAFHRHGVELAAALLCLAATEARGVDFNHDVRPILAEYCFKCHGPDRGARQAELRLDTFADATASRGEASAVIPHDLAASQLIQRITHSDPGQRMPPPSSGKTLSPDQIETLRQWITSGAKYEKHWSFVPAVRPRLADIGAPSSGWLRNALDCFVLARLQSEGLNPSTPCDRRTLIRRVSLDLTGLPPSLSEIRAFLSDKAPDAYERLVDRLLASPHFGERLTIDWLDAARYADTHGFNNDSTRTMWRWRDWVIDAYNANMPFDRFVVEQLAGDLLPGTTVNQRIATGFNRNHVINSEGGIIAEEYRVEYVADRVRTTTIVFLGLTMECARCHDHKYDPITQQDYYRFFAFFNNVPEYGEDGRIANAAPLMRAPTLAQQVVVGQLQKLVAAHETAMQRIRRQLPADSLATWVDEQREKLSQPTLNPAEEKYRDDLLAYVSFDQTDGDAVTDLARKDATILCKPKPVFCEGVVGAGLLLDSENFMDLGRDINMKKADSFSIGLWIRPDSTQSTTLISKVNYRANRASTAYGAGYEIGVDNEEVVVRLNTQPAYAIHVTSESAVQPRRWQHLLITYDGSKKAAGIRIFHNGRQLDTNVLSDGLSGGFDGGVPLLVGRADSDDRAGFRGQIDEFCFFKRALSAEEIVSYVDPLLVANALAAGHEDALVHQYLIATDQAYQGHWQSYLQKRDEIFNLERQFPLTMVMAEMEPARPTHVLQRGDYASPRELVAPTVLEELLVPLPADAPRNRLGLARWLTRADHPLTARVAVNRIWQQLFGTGIVKTAEDFGVQGEWPSHPDLLDYLAVEFVESGWDMKLLVRSLVTSATYRQESGVTPALLQLDPENRLLARGPRFRLPAELIRDQALAVAGMLQPRIGGASVYPYQPEGIFKDVVVGADYPGTKWLLSEGADLYRRSLYTFWKRTLPHPALATFDAPEREFCLVRRSRTNTPLQALVLLNDPIYLEASRRLAESVMADETGQRARVARCFELVTARAPNEAELQILLGQLHSRLDHYHKHPDAAASLLEIGASTADDSLDPVELAAYTTIASILLNLDEAITKG